ncbi:hypothetical protein GCM10010420_08020 [Streptomyces glaucosporus]|uniref:Uncharacterized protein n=1 Tax=Streptomyces glaucosporus TaxID=284044 RepID=A0ABP5UXK6_9ACTN
MRGGCEGELPPGEVECFGTVHAPTIGPRPGPARRPVVDNRGTTRVAAERGDVRRGLRAGAARPLGDRGSLPRFQARQSSQPGLTIPDS